MTLNIFLICLLDICIMSFAYLKICCFIFNFLAMLHSMWDLSSLTRDQTHAPCSWSWESWHRATREVPRFSRFFVVEFRSSLYILNINSLSDIQLVNIGTHSVSCLFILLTLSFDAQVFKLMRINLSTLLLSVTLVLCLRSFCLWLYSNTK